MWLLSHVASVTWLRPVTCDLSCVLNCHVWLLLHEASDLWLLSQVAYVMIGFCYSLWSPYMWLLSFEVLADNATHDHHVTMQHMTMILPFQKERRQRCPDNVAERMYVGIRTHSSAYNATDSPDEDQEQHHNSSDEDHK